MESDSTLGGGPPSPSFAALPAFFTNGSVDDTKYESLLADLRAHDLLGPVDTPGGDPGFGSSFGASAGSGSSSLFFNDAFSAVFMGNFSDGAASSTALGASAAKTPSSKPPPGFAGAPPGLAPSETDLKWARGQEEFSRIEEKFHSHGSASTAPTAAPAATARGDSTEKDSDLQIDESQIPSLRSLGLDDDDAPIATTPQPPTQPPPPPTAWQQPPPPPHMEPGPPPPPPAAWNQRQSNGPQPPYPPPMAPMNHQMRGPQPPMPPPPMHGQYPGMPPPPPPRGMQFPHPPPPPFYMGGPPPPPFARGGPMPMPMPMPMPAFKMMTPRDINFVVQQQMKQIRTSDPFSDDYYFHNYSQKRTRGGAPSGSSGGPAPGGRPALPLPSWRLEHVKSFDPRDAQRENKSRSWEQEFHVLGRNAKSSLYRPKQMLNLGGGGSGANASGDAAAEPEEAASATGESSAGVAEESAPPAPPVAEQHVLRMSEDAGRRSVFANETWHRRQQLDRGMQCLLSLQDARHILDARGVNVQQFHSMDAQAMDPALAELRARTTALLLELAALLGVAVTTDAAADPPTGVMSCDAAQLAAVLDAGKGRRLMARALPLLHPSARFVLLPRVAERELGRQAAGRAAADESDDRLCQALVLVLLYHPPAPPAELLTECLQRALEGHDERSLAAVLHHRARAEALQALLQRGGAAVQQLAGDEDARAQERLAAVKDRWERAQGTFVALATAIKQGA